MYIVVLRNENDYGHSSFFGNKFDAKEFCDIARKNGYDFVCFDVDKIFDYRFDIEKWIYDSELYKGDE